MLEGAEVAVLVGLGVAVSVGWNVGVLDGADVAVLVGSEVAVSVGVLEGAAVAVLADSGDPRGSNGVAGDSGLPVAAVAGVADGGAVTVTRATGEPDDCGVPSPGEPLSGRADRVGTPFGKRMASFDVPLPIRPMMTPNTREIRTVPSATRTIGRFISQLLFAQPSRNPTNLSQYRTSHIADWCGCETRFRQKLYQPIWTHQASEWGASCCETTSPAHGHDVLGDTTLPIDLNSGRYAFALRW